MIDEKKLTRYIKTEINPYGKPFEGTVYEFGNMLMDYIERMEKEPERKWIPVSERLPECENKYGWVSCIVSVIRSHYPISTYDICNSPYDENIVMHANYHVSQKIWHLESDEQLNALMDIEDAPLNGDYVIAWQPLPEPYKAGEKE